MDHDALPLLEKRLYREAFELLLHRYQSRIFRMALAILNDPGRAEEVAQDSFMKLWMALPHYDGRASLSTWLYTIARNTALSAARSPSHCKTTPLETVPEPSTAPAWQTDRYLAKFIDRLPDTQRQVILLFYLEDRQIDEVARMLGMPEGTVKSHLHRARLALAAAMKDG
jgi:RNA polymerase sigma-70 factor, ECF subfamily